MNVMPDGLTTIFEYSTDGDITSKTVIKNERQIQKNEYKYSNSGVVSVHLEPEDEYYSMTFDETGQLILLRRDGFPPFKTVRSSTTEIQYAGDLMVTKKVFSETGSSLLVEDGDGYSTRTVFNDNGQLVAFADGRGNNYEITLNPNGTIRNVSFPDGTNTFFIYEQNGHILHTQTGAIKRFKYNHERKLILKDIGNNAITTYDYDQNGKPTSVVNEHVRIHLTNANDSIASIAYPDRTINYTYDDEDLVSSISSSSGYFVKYERNSEGKVQKIRDTNGKILLEAKYSSTGKIVKKILGNNATTINEYDPLTGLLVKMTNYFPNGSVASFYNYTYSLRKMRVMVETHNGQWKFRYDRAGQIISMTDPKGTHTEYEYDQAKNRKIISVNGVKQLTTVNTMNQYETYGLTNFRYDKNGNLIMRNSSTVDYFKFDEDGKLIEFNAYGDSCVLRYDGLDNLHSKHCGNKTIRYVINPQGNYGSDLIEKVTTVNGKESTEFFYHGGEQIGLFASRVAEGSLLYFQYDPLGSVLGIINENGDLIKNYLSDPFGVEMFAKGPYESTFTFIGQWGVMQVEELSGIFFMRARFYDSHTGRFFSVDPYGIKAHSQNFYAYCFNNPVHFIDPAGTSVVSSNAKLHGLIASGIEGIYKGLVSRIPVVGHFLGMGSGVVKGYIQHKLDHEPYTWNDAIHDLARGVVNEALRPLEPFINAINIGCKLTSYFGDALGRINHYVQTAVNYVRKGCEVCDDIKKAASNVFDDVIKWILSHDPNDILGPPGFGAARFIPKNKEMQYKIRFENDENATAPAQRVYIELKYSQHLDLRTFSMGDFGFGNLSRAIAKGRKTFQGNINLTEEFGVIVKVFAGIDIAKQMIIWEFQSIDPTTGDVPSDPTVGFLPPNNGTSGQGFVSFSMKPKPDVQHLATIHANASIYFDQNEPIDTPNIINTIDDTTPTVNSSVVPGTEHIDSVTLSLNAADTGSGVKHVDLFKAEGEGYELLQAGITENIYVLSLTPGESLSLVPVPVDQVGNRRNIDAVGPDMFLNVTSTRDKASCNCWGHGNCSEYSNICVCETGFYGATCNTTVPPPEPPVLELRPGTGFVGEPINVYISARNMSGSFEDLEIVVYGFPPETNFSKGTLSIRDQHLKLSHEEFGDINVTAPTDGEIQMTVKVNQRFGRINFTRTDTLSVMMYPQITLDIDVNGCFSENDAGVIEILLNSSITPNLTTTDPNGKLFVIPHSLVVRTSDWVHPVGQLHADGVYYLNDILEDSVLELNGRFEPVDLVFILTVEPEGVPVITFSKSVEIKRFCVGDCSNHTYGVKCDKECLCEWENTVSSWCDKFNGSCFCAPELNGSSCNEFVCPCIANNTAICDVNNLNCTCKTEWTGNGCDIDVDECNDTLVCAAFPNTFCQNRLWGYDCHCLAGYYSENGTCHDCIEGVFGMDCDNKCSCDSQNTRHCDQFTGSCSCFHEWQGENCTSDVDECLNITICAMHPHTFCQNKVWGYDCLCNSGYRLENDVCVDCNEGTYGLNCSNRCTCVPSHTRSCNKVNGSCTCVPEWQGVNCDLDVNECTNRKICDVFPHTFCKNKDWGYDCLCERGYHSKNGTCVECDLGKFGMNCSQTCTCVWNHTVECSKVDGSCHCNPYWEGNNCQSDYDECTKRGICDVRPNSVCKNREWGYVCICMEGFFSRNGSCIAKKETSVVLRVDVKIPESVSLEDKATYETYKQKATTMLTTYYKAKLGDGFIEVIIKNISKGSLVVDHEVVTEDAGNVTQTLTEALFQVVEEKNSTLVYDGEYVTVETINVNKIQVTDSDSTCDLFMSIQNCDPVHSKCEVDANNRMSCRSVDQAENDDHFTLIIASSAGGGVVLLIIITCVCIAYHERKKNK